jgi:hypothetical protein
LAHDIERLDHLWHLEDGVLHTQTEQREVPSP